MFVIGNEANPAACKIEISSGVCVAARDGGIVTIKGFRFNATTAGCNALDASQFGVIDFANCDFGNFAGGYHVSATELGAANGLGNYTVSGGARAHLFADEGGKIKLGAPAVAVSAPLNFSGAWAMANNRGTITYAGRGTFSGAGAGANTSAAVYSADGGTIRFRGTTPPGTRGGPNINGGVIAG